MTILLSDGTSQLSLQQKKQYNIKDLPNDLLSATPKQLESYFNKLGDKEEILFLASSSLLHPMYFTASIAAKQCPHVTVCDSKDISLGYGMQLMAASVMIQQGTLIEHIGKELVNTREHQRTMLYMHRKPYEKNTLPSLNFTMNPWCVWQRMFVMNLSAGRPDTRKHFVSKKQALHHFMQTAETEIKEFGCENVRIGIVSKNNDRVIKELKNRLLDLGCLNGNIMEVNNLSYPGLDDRDIFISIMKWKE